MFLDIAIVERNPFSAAVLCQEFAHHAFRKKPFIHIPLIVPKVPAQFCQEFCFRHCERDIRKAGLAFELGCDGKAEQDIKRNMAVVPALVWHGLCKVFREPMSFHRKDDVVNQVGE